VKVRNQTIFRRNTIGTSATLVIWAAALSLVTPAYATPKEDHPEWFECKSDDQCVTVCIPCGPVGAMNKEYANHADELGIQACLASVICDWEHSRAICKNQRCDVVSKEKSQ
jgi:hypothetical protein